MSASPTYEMLRVAESFSLWNIVIGHARRKTAPPKAGWSKRVWARAWELDDQLIIANQFVNPNSDLLRCICGKSKYISWWALADKRPWLIRICEMLVRIVSKVNRLESDDFNLKKESFLD